MDAWFNTASNQVTNALGSRISLVCSFVPKHPQSLLFSGTDHASRPYKTIRKIVVVYTLIFEVSGGTQDDKNILKCTVVSIPGI
jgi:hypothetical protein